MKKKIEKETEKFLKSGLCCSESIAKAIMENSEQNCDGRIVKAASGFGAGVGGSREDICGALSGSVLALGLLYGRSEPEEDKKKIQLLSSELLNKFKEKHQSTRCSEILKNFGEQKNGEKCCALTIETSGLVQELIDQHC